VFSEKFRQNLVFSILGKTIFYLKLIPSSAFWLSDWSFGSVFVALHELDVFRRFVVPVEFSGQLVVDILTELHCKSAKFGVSAQLKQIKLIIVIYKSFMVMFIVKLKLVIDYKMIIPFQ